MEGERAEASDAAQIVRWVFLGVMVVVVVVLIVCATRQGTPTTQDRKAEIMKYIGRDLAALADKRKAADEGRMAFVKELKDVKEDDKEAGQKLAEKIRREILPAHQKLHGALKKVKVEFSELNWVHLKLIGGTETMTKAFEQLVQALSTGDKEQRTEATKMLGEGEALVGGGYQKLDELVREYRLN